MHKDGEPNLDEVLRDGLDTHADGIQREKVINMVGQALDAFKGQKQILDKAKDKHLNCMMHASLC